MPKKTTFLILILAVVTGVLLFLAVSENQKGTTTQTPLPTKKIVQKTAKVFFNPQNLDLSEGTASPASTVDLMVDTGTSTISGVQVEAQFDPKALASVKLIPALDENSFFGAGATVLFNDINLETGRISYAITISSSQNVKRGVGKIATFSFQKAYTAPATTTITLLDKTLVTVLGENQSVLKEALPLNITLSKTPGVQTQTSPVTSPAVQNLNY